MDWRGRNDTTDRLGMKRKGGIVNQAGRKVCVKGSISVGGGRGGLVVEEEEMRNCMRNVMRRKKGVHQYITTCFIIFP